MRAYIRQMKDRNNVLFHITADDGIEYSSYGSGSDLFSSLALAVTPALRQSQENVAMTEAKRLAMDALFRDDPGPFVLKTGERKSDYERTDTGALMRPEQYRLLTELGKKIIRHINRSFAPFELVVDGSVGEENVTKAVKNELSEIIGAAGNDEHTMRELLNTLRVFRRNMD